MQTINFRYFTAAALLAGLILGMAYPASALPVFARKYGYQCTMCHSQFPRLNDFGQRYRQNGYQLPGKESEERTTTASPAPFALRTSAGANYDKFKNPTASDKEIKQFQVNGLDLFSAGVIAKNISYLAAYLPPIEAARGTVTQDGALEAANVVFAHLFSTTWVNLRVGRFEPAYVAFSDKRRFTLRNLQFCLFGWAGGCADSGRDRNHRLRSAGDKLCRRCGKWIGDEWIQHRDA
jgi:hypothetical protein